MFAKLFCGAVARSLWRVLFVFVVLIFPACGSSSTGGGQGAMSTTSSTGSSSSHGTSGGCASDADCNDGFNCTVDACVAGSCTHSIGPASGPTACTAGQYCTVEKGCIMSPACATDADCEKVFANDPCKQNPHCDGASSVCLFDILDKDMDGYPPIVCGGGDCNDEDPAIHPGAPKVCGKDMDCSGSTNGPCSDPLESCQGGVCACMPENACGQLCVDKMTNNGNCGSCGHTCVGGQMCEAGTCKCPAPQISCNGSCTDPTCDDNNCGACGNVCTGLLACRNGTCACGSKMGCTGMVNTCADLPSDPSNPPMPVVCGGVCINTLFDNNHCGSCTACPGTTTCHCGHCQ